MDKLMTVQDLMDRHFTERSLSEHSLQRGVRRGERSLAVTLVDVRSPSEFAESSIPGAINLPIFNDQERALVGTIYRHAGEAEARRLGVQLLAPKLPDYIERFHTLPSPTVVFCWRGGMRSRSVSQLLALAGVPVWRLIGGYKAYRRFVNDYLQQKPQRPVVVLDGLTGVGKTEIIAGLKDRGLGAIDLEALAKNRGSVFGSVGMGRPPSQKDFEAALAESMIGYHQASCWIVECESPRIGRLIVPRTLVEAMGEGEHILLYASLESRVERIVRMYGSNPPAALAAPLERLVKRLGRERVQELKGLLDAGDLKQLTRILLLEYYDPLYRYPTAPTSEYAFAVSTDDSERAVEQIAAYLQRYSDNIPPGKG